MQTLLEFAPGLIAMLVLIGFSGMFSGAEAALFSLPPPERARLASGGPAARAAAKLLLDPDRLLSTILFWNLVVNMCYFGLASVIGLRLEDRPSYGSTGAALFSAVAVLLLIFFGEMLPKSLGVMLSRRGALLAAWPLAAVARATDPILPLLRGVTVLSQRLAWPRFRPEPYLELADLERAIELSTHDAQLVAQEKAMLRNIVGLSDMRVEEWMRPRTQFKAFSPPVSWERLGGKLPAGGYLFVTERDSDEVALALNLQTLTEAPREHLEHLAQPVVYAPWCATVADVLEQLESKQREAAAVVNEYGETIGVLTREDLLAALFTYNPSRSLMLLNRKPIHDIEAGKWLVTGMTSLRRLERHLKHALPPSKSVTVAGVVQEKLGRLLRQGDHCQWGDYHLRVLETPALGGHTLIEVVRVGREKRR